MAVSIGITRLTKSLSVVGSNPTCLAKTIAKTRWNHWNSNGSFDLSTVVLFLIILCYSLLCSPKVVK